MTPLLSVCIPTYNRARYLPDALDSVISQIHDRTPVEIVISDNASTDATPSIIEKYQRTRPYIRSVRQTTNNGVQRNILDVPQLAAGEYCWLLGDDDVLCPGALELVLDEISHGEQILLSDVTVCDQSLKPVQYWPTFSGIGSTVFDMARESEYIQFFERSRNLNAFFGYISVLIFKRALWNRTSIAEMFLETRSAHAAVLLDAVRERSIKLKYLSRSLVLTRSGTPHAVPIVPAAYKSGWYGIGDTLFGPPSRESFYIRRAVRLQEMYGTGGRIGYVAREVLPAWSWPLLGRVYRALRPSSARGRQK